MNYKRKLWELKEGLLVGGIWGFSSIYMTLGMASIPGPLNILEKIMIAPTYLAGMIVGDATPNVLFLLLPISIGAVFGAIFDNYYKVGQ